MNATAISHHPPPARRRTGAEDSNRRDQILDTALAVASARGFDGTHIRDVAQHAGLAAGSLYRHFTSKTHLLVSVLTREFQRVDTEFDWAAGEHTPQRRLERLMTHLHDEWQTKPLLTEAMVRAFAAADESVGESVQEAVNVIEDMLARAVGGPSPSELDQRVAGVIGDIWLANLTAVISGRVPPDEARTRIDQATGLLIMTLTSSQST
ncbi:TetR family transcriptional regulator [Mycobacterium sp. NPDC051804]|uniref:TetR family transcriptional regulator n=1 Tax=Mycobacterium sp. NPDC051804 TaxID=3364295 RepID=UPI003789A615